VLAPKVYFFSFNFSDSFNPLKKYFVTLQIASLLFGSFGNAFSVGTLNYTKIMGALHCSLKLK
jgi:hypothetical protein